MDAFKKEQETGADFKRLALEYIKKS